MKNRKLLFGSVIIILIALWAAFRPERLFVDAKVNESLESMGASAAMADKPLETGTFHGVAHNGSGSAAILQLPDGRRILRFTNFQTSNGPDVHVYLVAANDANDSDTVKKAGFIEIASLKGNVGDQNYELPATLDLNKYHAVTIWCQRFGVNFATAPLTSTQATTAMRN